MNALLDGLKALGAARLAALAAVAMGMLGMLALLALRGGNRADGAAVRRPRPARCRADGRPA